MLSVLRSGPRLALALLFASGGLGACASPPDTCDRLASTDAYLERTVTRCVVGTELQLGLIKLLEDYKTACKVIQLACGEDALSPVREALDCLDRVDPCPGDAAQRAASEQELRLCSDRLRGQSPQALKACVPGA